MRVFFDTNILLDVIENRPGLVEARQDVLTRCDELQAETFIAWHSLATTYYILKRGRTSAEALAEVDKILAWADIAPVTKLTAHQARALAFADFEDAMQAAAAVECQAHLIVTRNLKDFTSSPVPACTPEEFLVRHGSPGAV
ncbi:type II toxin-antitoxin system VapC family toxin [Prosthecobacter sp.]|uniref:type II toxin-antitoxin system VapC family toxin n=1 Tax=Prosthecobacter sp. TaxID=1965333 RepID=UPI003783F5BA